MSSVSPQTNDQRPANLSALQQGLQEMMTRVKRTNGDSKDRDREVRGPVLVIRGK
jgi:hypothetical protein